MKYQLEIRAGEGGKDAKLFVNDLMSAYIRMFDRKGWKWQGLHHTEGYAHVQVDALEALEQESGGHRIQRVPPTERKGRVHTSTVTVAVLSIALATVNSQKIKTQDIRTDWFSGTGAGGQHRNKHQNSCRLTHIPTGVTVISQCRKRTQSFNTAMDELQRRLAATAHQSMSSNIAATRKQQTGSGMRADKIRTYRFQDDIVKDHRTSKTSKTSRIMRGGFDGLWH